MFGAEPALVLGLAFALDSTLREPPAVLHPVVWMGRAIAPLTRLAPRASSAELWLGGLYAALISAGFALAAALALRGASAHLALALSVQSFLLWSSFALAGLCAAGEELERALAAGDLGR